MTDDGCASGDRLSRWLADACALIGFYGSAPNFPAGVLALLIDKRPKWPLPRRPSGRSRSRPPRQSRGHPQRGHPTLSGMLESHGYDFLILDAATAE